MRNQLVDAGTALTQTGSAAFAVAPAAAPSGSMNGAGAASNASAASAFAAGWGQSANSTAGPVARAWAFSGDFFGASEMGRPTGANFGNRPCSTIRYRPEWFPPFTKLLLTLSNFIRLIRVSDQFERFRQQPFIHHAGCLVTFGVPDLEPVQQSHQDRFLPDGRRPSHRFTQTNPPAPIQSDPVRLSS